MPNYPALYLATMTSPKGRSTMLALLNRLPKYNNDIPIDWTKITSSFVLELLANMETDGLSIATLNMALSGIKGVCHAAWSERGLSDDAYARIKDIKQRKQTKLPAGRAITHLEVDGLFDACHRDRNRTKGVRDALILAFGLYVGLRRSEIVAIKAKHIDLENMTIQLIGKGNKEEILPLADVIKPMMLEWLALRNDAVITHKLTGQHLFGRITKSGRIVNLEGITDSQVREILRNLTLESGVDVDNLPTPHDMRRTRATTLLDAGVHPRIAQKMMRHANVETTMRYDRGNIDDALRDAVNMN